MPGNTKKHRRGNGEGSVYQRKDGTWAAVLTVGVKPDGKPDRKFLYGKTRKEVADKLREAQNKLDAGVIPGGDNVLFSTWVMNWLEIVIKPGIKERTYINYKASIEKHIIPGIGRYKLKDITDDVIQKYLNDQQEHGKTDLSRRSLMITEEMVLLLIFWRLMQNIEKKKAAERGIEYNPDNLVFCTRKGTYIYPRNFTKMWSENLRSMGIDHKRFHDLRHTVATVMLEDGEAMNTVQEQLGHYDAGFTASRYGHVTAKMRNSAAVKLGERLEKVRNPEAEDAEDANSVKNEDTIIPFQEGRKLKSAACKIK